MEDKVDKQSARIEIHGDELGVPGEEQVEQRAREIAKINNRDPVDVTDADREQAREELRYQGAAIMNDDAGSEVMASSDPAEPRIDTGHKAPETEEPDEQAVFDKEVHEGVDEALHDSMLAAEYRDEEDGNKV